MNAVGIDVSKGKSTVAVLRPYGEVVVSPFDVAHTGSDLRALADLRQHRIISTYKQNHPAKC